MLTIKIFSEMTPDEFRDYLNNLQAYLKNTDVSFRALQNFTRDLTRKFNITDDERIRRIYKIISKKMKKMLEDGYVNKKRVPNTGTKVEERRFYEDNAKNRNLNRVGKPYIYTYWQNAQMRDVTPRVKRVQRAVNGEKPRQSNKWIESVKQARTELLKEGHDFKFVTIRKEASNPDDKDQTLGVLLYQRALAIHQSK